MRKSLAAVLTCSAFDSSSDSSSDPEEAPFPRTRENFTSSASTWGQIGSQMVLAWDFNKLPTKPCHVWSLSVFLLFCLFIFRELSIIFLVDNIVLLQLLVVAVFPWLIKCGDKNYSNKCCKDYWMGWMFHIKIQIFWDPIVNCCWPESWQDVRCRIAHSSPLHSWCSSLDGRSIGVMLGCSSLTELGQHWTPWLLYIPGEKSHGETCLWK